MLTRVTIRNFKQFDDVTIELGNPVVFIGPNNSGKTTALQALALWQIGVRRWLEKRGTVKSDASPRETGKPKQRTGVVINRRDLVSTPIPDAKLLWKDLHVRRGTRDSGKPLTSNIRVEIVVEGVSGDRCWECGLEFDYANEESIYVRPLKPVSELDSPIALPQDALDTEVVFLPPMSGLAANETRLDPGAVAVRIGEGRTAEVLRNLCLVVAQGDPDRWDELVRQMENLFGCKVSPPLYVSERGEIEMTYQDRSGIQLDISCSGRGFQQTLLLLAHLATRQNSVLLLDEPDAHLEILRQRSLYHRLVAQARQSNCQIVAASHSEVILNEAADRDVVVAFVGRPHRIDDRGVQVLKSLKEIGFEQYYQAELTGWVLYVEGSTDLSVLRSLAKRLQHPVTEFLEQPFVHYIDNQPQRGKSHFFALLEAKPDLQGFILCDRLDREAEPSAQLDHYNWSRREIENYICQPQTLLAWAASQGGKQSPGGLFEPRDRARFQEVMQNCLNDLVAPRAMRDRDDSWWQTVKATDDFLDRLFADFTKQLGLPSGHFRKSDYHQLADFVEESEIDPEVKLVLDRIYRSAEQAIPRRQ